jgi:ABC-type lipoprotein release transport system permease subunit
MKKYASFTLLLILYVVNLGVQKLPQQKIAAIWNGFYTKAISKLNIENAGSITRIILIDLAMRNMQAKKTRTAITVGGMAIGIGSIVFLVSIGYGLQNLVISRVASLTEMKQADITPQTGGKVLINDKTLSDFKSIPAVTMVLPLISVVGEVNYQNSVTDMAVYGVTADYLKQSAVKPAQGKIFENNDISFIFAPEVAGAASGGQINFTINSGSWVKVRESADASAKILGYTKGTDIMTGEEVAGSGYITNDGGRSSTWVKSQFLLWQKDGCDPGADGDCETGGYRVIRDKENFQAHSEGYAAEININIVVLSQTDAVNNVLGTTTVMPGVSIASESATAQVQDVKTVDISASAAKVAVINMAALKVLGITEAQATGKTFDVSFIVTGDLLSDPSQKIQSVPVKYTVIGAVPGDASPFFYVPFTDLRSLGIANYSQVKIAVDNQTNLPKVRRQTEAMGFVTQSVADTVSQINSLFATLKTVLALFGMIALAVAALGMFNTLTVSLMERTREVGLMKAMGMKFSEVQELFLTESMIMGFFGGILGIVLGWVIGIVLSILLSFFAFFKGVGFVNVSYIPVLFIFVIVFLSLLVGFITGIYPARRATKISALNALRYE